MENLLKIFKYQGEPCRLDKALQQKNPDFSRTFFAKLIEDGFILVNSKIICKASFLIKNEDEIEICFEEQSFEVPKTTTEIEIIVEEKDFFIINKPAGLITHPAPTSKNDPSVVSILSPKLENISEFENQARPGIVHRLDKDTSGLMIIAKNQSALAKLSSLFAERKIVKKYLAIIEGSPTWNQITCEQPIGRNPRDPAKMLVYGIAAKPAKTIFTVLKRTENYTLLEAEIFTGRTHQIRVHLKHLGFFLVGDKTYGKESKLINRQALHAYFLNFTFEKKITNITLPLPKELSSIFS